MKKTLEMTINFNGKEKGKRKNSYLSARITMGPQDHKVLGFLIESGNTEMLLTTLSGMAQKEAKKQDAAFVSVNSFFIREILEVDGKIYRGVDCDYSLIYNANDINEFPILANFEA